MDLSERWSSFMGSKAGKVVLYVSVFVAVALLLTAVILSITNTVVASSIVASSSSSASSTSGSATSSAASSASSSLSTPLVMTDEVTTYTATGPLNLTTQLSTQPVNVLNPLNVTSQVDATSATAGGALTVSGGGAFAKSLYVGTNSNIGGNETVTGTLRAGTLLAPTVNSASGTLGLQGGTLGTNNVTILNTTTSTTPTTGALLVAGGLGVAGTTTLGNNLTVTTGNSILTENIYSPTTNIPLTLQGNGSAGVTVSGVLGVSSNLQVTGTMEGNTLRQLSGTTLTMGAGGGSNTIAVNNTLASTTAATGALTVAGGLGIAGNASVGGSLLLAASTTNSYTITPTTPAAARAIGWPDPGNSANVMLTSIKGATPNPTQLTSNTTAVTSTATVGSVQMFAIIAASGSPTFTMNNVNILATSNVVAWSSSVAATTITPVIVTVSSIASGSCSINVNNTDSSHGTVTAPLLYYLIM